jgi:sulfatase maturation enzyme AslB (radical SAM superfamily)
MDGTIIYGAGEQGRAARRILESQGLVPAAFADRDETKVTCGGWEGVRVIGLDALKKADKSTPIIIGIGAGRVDLLRQIDNMLTEWGFANIFWSAMEFLEKTYPDKEPEKTFYGLEICTNVGCSVRCKWCAQELFVSRYAERIAAQSPRLPKDFLMSLETFKKCIDQIPRNISVDFSGYSETFLNPLAAEMILSAARKDHKIILYTTLQGMTDNDINRLKDVEFEHIMPHLPDKDGNANIPVTDAYLKLLVRFWETFGYAIGSNSNSILANGISFHGELHPRVAETLLNNGIDASKYGNFSEDALPIAGNAEIGAHMEISNNFDIVCGLISYCDTGAVNKDDMKFFGEKLQTMPVLFPNGDVTVCNHDYGLTMVLGNMLQTDYYDLFEGNPNYERILAAQRDPNADVLCRKCEFAFDRRQMELVTRATHLKG